MKHSEDYKEACDEDLDERFKEIEKEWNEAKYWKRYSKALEKMLVSYRTGRCPSEKTFNELDFCKRKLGL